MPGPNRINIEGLICSCIAHGAIMGGLLFSNWSPPPRMLDQHEMRPPLVIDLIPLDAEGSFHRAAAPPSASPRQPPTAGPGATPVRPVAAVQPVARSSAATISKNSASAPEAAGGAPAAVSGAQLDAYQRQLYEIVARNSRYPAEAKRLRLSGITHLAFRLDRLGNVLDTWVQESSGSEVLDAAALDALKRSQPLPPIPPSLPSRLDFVIEIDSSLLQQLALSTGG